MGYFQLKGLFSKHETCSCRPAIFVHGRFDESTIFFDQWKLSKQTSYWSKTGFSFSVKNHNKFSSQNLVISSQNNVPKYRTRGHEQAYKRWRKSPDKMRIHTYVVIYVENGSWTKVKKISCDIKPPLKLCQIMMKNLKCHLGVWKTCPKK